MDAMDGQLELEPVVISLPIDVPSSSGSHEHAPLAELASESDSLPQATSKMHEEENEHHMCRVCRSDEGNLYYPCLCTGSIKYVHQECLLEWLKYSKKEVCELCNYKYSFQPIYRPDMPKALPVVEIIKGIAVSALRIVKMWLLYTIVIIAWLGIVPLTAARIYQAVFSANIQNVIYLPLHIFTTEHLATDCAKGMFLLAIFICMFISLVWLREQIIHGGPQEWLQLDDIEDAEEAQQADPEPPLEEAPRAPLFRHANYVPEAAPHAEAENRPDAPVPFPEAEEVPQSSGLERNTSGVPLVFGGQGSASGTGDQDAEDFWTRPPPVVMIEAPDGIELESDDSSSSDEETDDGEGEEEGGQEEQEEADNDAAPAAEDNWRDWDRLGDELTLARLVGLDGSLAFLEHVFWVISLNTLFTVLFAFSPFKLGSWILTTTGVRGKIVFFPSLACILTGYFAVSVIVFVLHRVCGLLRIKSLYRLLGIVFLVLKVFLLVLMEIGFFPIMCGWWMDLCSLPLFSATLSSRISSFSASPTSSLFLHWMIGMIYVFYSASFVLLLREVLRPGVLWFMRNLNDPEFNPIMEMIELPVARHLRRLVASTSLFFMAILLIVYLPLRVIQKVLPSILPYNMSLSAETPLSELSLELLILQVVLPALLEQTSARTLLKKAVKAWCIIVGRLLKLDRYLLSDNDNNRQNHGNANAAGAEQQPRPRIQQADDGGEPGADGIVGGGLAAEHQALLLLREPIVFEPYTRPSLFPLRILALLGLLSLSATLSSCVCFVVPVSIGRAFIHAMTGHSNVHELYTTGAGLYICWLVAKIITISCEWLNRGGAHLWSMFKNSLNLALHLLLAVLPVVFIIPFLIGVCFQLVVVSPLRVGLQQTPLFFPWQEWAMGVLHMKIFVAGVMMGPEWWMKQAFEQVYQDGVHGLRVGFIYRDIVLPVLVALSMQIATPYAIANIVLSVWSPSLEERVVLLRFCYPFILCIVGLVGFAIWQVNKLRTLAQNIRNEKYLVGTQLVNYERKEEERKIREKEEAEEKEKTRVRVEEENAERVADGEREERVEDAEIEGVEDAEIEGNMVVEQDV